MRAPCWVRGTAACGSEHSTPSSMHCCLKRPRTPSQHSAALTPACISLLHPPPTRPVPPPTAPPPQFVMGSLAMKATERDPDFLPNFQAALGGNKRRTGAGGKRARAVLPPGPGRKRCSAAACLPDHLPAALPHSCPLTRSHRGLRGGRHAGHHCARGVHGQERQGPGPLLWPRDALAQGGAARRPGERWGLRAGGNGVDSCAGGRLPASAEQRAPCRIACGPARIA